MGKELMLQEIQVLQNVSLMRSW